MRGAKGVKSPKAAWKFFILCGVGIALALFGTILLYLAAQPVVGSGDPGLSWAALRAVALSVSYRVLKNVRPIQPLKIAATAMMCHVSELEGFLRVGLSTSAPQGSASTRSKKSSVCVAPRELSPSWARNRGGRIA
jgi:hypothetical protein